MSDYYISAMDKTFFLSGSLIYYTDESGSDADKSNGELVNKNFMLDCNVSTREAFNIKEMMIMSYHVTGSYTYLMDRGMI